MNAAEHILVAEDDWGVRDTLKMALESEGYRVTVANGGASMRDMLNTGDPVNLVVIDAAMPGEDSVSLALHLKALRVPVVMISGSPQMIEFAMNNDLQLLRKPFKVGDLAAAIAVAFGSGEFGQREKT
jgi:two-component system OmpR family response regulator